MKRNNSQKLGDLLRDFFEENSELYDKMMEIRIQRSWKEVLGPMVMQYTRTVYVRDKVLYVYLTSSVLRSELILCREKLVKSLNEYAGSSVIKDIVIRLISFMADKLRCGNYHIHWDIKVLNGNFFDKLKPVTNSYFIRFSVF